MKSDIGCTKYFSNANGTVNCFGIYALALHLILQAKEKKLFVSSCVMTTGINLSQPQFSHLYNGIKMPSSNDK